MSGITKPVLRMVKDRANAALQNEQITRGRVEGLESRIGGLAACVEALEAKWNGSLWARLRWLLSGK
jgi:hypothetical protein